MKLAHAYFGLIGLLLFVAGCENPNSDELAEKAPRPVVVETLALSPPPSSVLVSAAVASWKTEQIGFEVGGRIEWVAEPNTDIEGRVVSGNGELLIEGTPIARIENERYRLQRDSALAEVERSKQAVAAAEIELNKSLKSQMQAAQAEMKLAKTEYDRSLRLLEQSAGAQSDVDRDEANYQTALANIEQIEASQRAKAAEVVSLKLQIEKANQSLRDAERSLEDCTLYSSFRGQLADVSVVPGSVVSAGAAVTTIQMMNPIKIELEVSAEESRRLRKRQVIPVHVPTPDGSTRLEEGFLYLIDSVADPQTRTFTLTLLILNERMGTDGPALSDDLARTDQAWRMDFKFLPGAEEGVVYVSEEAVHEDELGPFVWRVNNFDVGQLLPQDHILDVSKMRVKLGETKLPFLGNWIFQQVEILDETFDIKRHMVAGKLTVAEGEPDQWNGTKIVVRRDTQWMVRPGDLVKVDLTSEDAEPGYFVPMDAIAFEAGKKYLLVVDGDGSSDTATVSRVEVVVDEIQGSTSSLRRISHANGGSLDGLRFVTQGAHYLVDGEAVQISKGDQ